LLYYTYFTEDPRGRICTKFGRAVKVADLIAHDQFFGDRLSGVYCVVVEFCASPLTNRVGVSRWLAGWLAGWRYASVLCAAECVYGDSRAPFDDGTTCSTRLSTQPALCYHDHYNSTCCRTCQQIRDRHSPGQRCCCASVCPSVCHVSD